MTPLLSPTPCEVVETKVLDKKYTKTFPICVVTYSQSKNLRESTGHFKIDVVTETMVAEVFRSEDPPPFDLADSIC